MFTHGLTNRPDEWLPLGSEKPGNYYVAQESFPTLQFDDKSLPKPGIVHFLNFIPIDAQLHKRCQDAQATPHFHGAREGSDELARDEQTCGPNSIQKKTSAISQISDPTG